MTTIAVVDSSGAASGRPGKAMLWGSMGGIVVGGVCLGVGIWLFVRSGFTETSSGEIVASRSDPNLPGTVEVDVKYNPANRGERTSKLLLPAGLDVTIGRKITIRFNPENPDAIGVQREPGLHSGSFFLMGSGTVLLIIGLLLLFLHIRSRRRSPMVAPAPTVVQP